MTGVVPLLLITGPIGVGKTAVASEVSEQLDTAGVAHALVDIDTLRWCYPRPPDDRFHRRLAMANLAAIWPNFRAAGAQRLVIADTIESRAELASFAAAIPGAAIVVVRLRASSTALARRIAHREVGSGLARHLERAVELTAIFDQARLEDHVIETDDLSVVEVARVVLARVGWLG